MQDVFLQRKNSGAAGAEGVATELNFFLSSDKNLSIENSGERKKLLSWRL
jgi:hypothetical protein